MKFKYFFNSLSGTPGEQEVNDWLNENNNIELIKVSTNNGCLTIFYKEKDNFTILSKEEIERLNIEDYYIYQSKFFEWYTEYYLLLMKVTEKFYIKG